MIVHLQHDAIDKQWWDHCLEACANRSWYARSYVLDAVSPGWEALVDDAAGAIMPLTAARRWGFHYLRQPFPIQQLGVFAASPSAERCGDFLRAVPARYRVWDIRLNGVACTGAPVHVHLRKAVDRVVDLTDGIEAIRSRYGESHRRGLRKWDAVGKPEPMDPSTFIDFVLHSVQARSWKLAGWQRDGFRRVVHATSERGEGKAMGIRHEGAWVAAGFFVPSWDRMIFLKGLANEDGRKVFAMHRLMDAMIAEAVGRHRMFDLAGGEVPAMERFYAGFGARTDLYLHARVNRLPLPLRWYKRWIDGA